MDDPAQRSARLRAQLQTMFPSSLSASNTGSVDVLSCGLSPLDRLLRGGLPLGGVTAWCGREGDGLTSLLCSTVARALSDGHRVAVVDGSRSLDPIDWARLGRRARFWVIRPTVIAEALWAAEELARSGVFRLVSLDLGSGWSCGSVNRVASRLRYAAREGGSALLVLGDISPGHVGASLALRSEALRPHLEQGSRSLRLIRIRGGSPEQVEVVFDVERRLFPCRLSTDPGVPDRRGSTPAHRVGRSPVGPDPG